VQAQGFLPTAGQVQKPRRFLGVGPTLLPAADLADANALTLEVRINGSLRQTVDLRQMRRPLTQLLADVNDFMTLQAGDVLMLGLDICTDGPDAGHRPHARVGDVIEIQAPGHAGLGVMRHTLVAAPALEMPV